jgi:hypothetical protein
LEDEEHQHCGHCCRRCCPEVDHHCLDLNFFTVESSSRFGVL